MWIDRLRARRALTLSMLALGSASATASTLPPGGESVSIKPAPAFTQAQLTAPPSAGWLTNGGNLSNQRYSPLTEINRETVKGLKAEWRTHLSGSGMGPQHSGQAQPLFYAGVLYLVTGADDVFALDVKRGETLWSYQANLDPARVKVCCGWVSRGLGMGDGKLFVGQLDARLVALDQRTGKDVWSQTFDAGTVLLHSQESDLAGIVTHSRMLQREIEHLAS